MLHMISLDIYKFEKKMMRLFLLSILILSLGSCQEPKNDSQSNVPINADADLYKIGDSLSLIAQQTLLHKVATAMQSGGTEYALNFCHINAFEIVDSLSKNYDVEISRISNKNRNPNNLPTAFEAQLLKDLESLNLKDTIIHNNNKSTYYKSIKMGLTTCLKCHGPVESIDPNVYALLKEKYPNDKAVNYSLNDFRGAWKIVLE